ncbi:MAG: metallophosphoesterase [Chloroflexi bacterium]|nr:metallophosphoesterase [Chloroflexota bacterium]
MRGGITVEERRSVIVAAIGDLHCHSESVGHIRPLFAEVNDRADFLALAGDLTLSGEVREIEVLIGELEEIRVPIVAVLGNHDYELGHEAELTRLLEGAGIRVLDGDAVVLEAHGRRVGFVGAKGFGGGFDKYLLAPYGESALKDFAHAGRREVRKVEAGLSSLSADYRVVILHYAPCRETLRGEALELYPFLGCSELCRPIDQLGADVVFHGHAHYGVLEGRTKTGIPVFNVASPLVRRAFFYELSERSAPEGAARPVRDEP